MTAMTREEILANPGAAQSALEGATATARSPLPDAELPPPDLVKLPGGLVHKGGVIRTAVVRELTGEDEEALARALQSNSFYHLLDVLLRAGVVRLGSLDHDESQKLLPDLLTGDRDEIILGIRTATYGDIVEAYNWICTSCGKSVDKLEFSLASDVTRVTLKDPAAGTVFDVKLRKGGSARVRLVTGRVQAAAFERDDLVGPQRDDIVLSQCVDTYTDPAGAAHLIPGFPSMVRKMSAPDRRKILQELSKRQPGPRYNEVAFKHDGCGEEVTLALGITDLFRDLITGLV
jgi:hypothetical protein